MKELLEEKGLTQLEVAERTGRPKKTINEIIQAKAAITAETALQFEKVLGVPADFLLSLEAKYREVLARQAEREVLTRDIPWAKSLPIKDMVKLGWIEKVSDDLLQVEEVLRFLGSATRTAWDNVSAQMLTEVAYRQSMIYDSDRERVALWLRRGEIEAQNVRTEPFDSDRFHGALKEIRALTCTWPFEQELYGLCEGSGVVVRFVKELPKIRISGVTRWLTPKRALIQLTLRFRWQDQVWFSFFHEAAHILLHGKRDTFVEPDRRPETPNDFPAEAKVRKLEQEADRFAQDLLVPPDAYRRFRVSGHFDAPRIKSFAKEIGVAPGIVLGRLQHDGVIPWPSPLNSSLKKRFEWAGSET